MGLVHHDALARDDVDPVFLAELDRRRRLGSLLHPDVLNAQAGCLMDQLFGDLRLGDDDQAADLFGQGLKGGIAGVAVDGWGIRIDRQDRYPLAFSSL
jgi:hypothetical protein